jgi:hypothetical protein
MNCNRSVDPEERRLAVIAMFLYMSRGGLVWLLNLGLFIFLLILAVRYQVSFNFVINNYYYCIYI